MDQTKAIEIAKRYFHAWPKVDQFFITSDGLAFFNAQDAAAHASRKDKLVIQVQRSQITGSTTGAETVTPAPAGGTASAAPSGTAAATK